MYKRQEKRSAESKDSEERYMKKEIERAIKSIEDNKTEQNKIEDEIKQLNIKIDEKISKDNTDHAETQQRVSLLKSQLEQEGHNLELLHSKLGYITDQLSKIQPSRGRLATNGRLKK